MLGDGIELDARDYTHGTEVTSIIVDGPTINPMLAVQSEAFWRCQNG